MMITDQQVKDAQLCVSAAKKQAEELLPCQDPPSCGFDGGHWGSCVAPYRPAVAAALEAKDLHWIKLNDNQRMSDAAFYSDMIKKAEAEHDNLRTQLTFCKEVQFPRKLDAVTSALRAQLAALEEKVDELEQPMECGHYGANLQPDDSNNDICMVCAELDALKAQIKPINTLT